MTLPAKIRDGLRTQLWSEADSCDWFLMVAPEKSRQYDDWVVREDVGGLLSRYMDPREVRVYLKDTVIKEYAIQRMQSHERAFRVLGLAPDSRVVEEYRKPHGRRLEDGRIVCWGPASNWKAIVMAVFERSRLQGLSPYAVVLVGATGRFKSATTRGLVEDAAGRLGIGCVAWLDS